MAVNWETCPTCYGADVDCPDNCEPDTCQGDAVSEIELRPVHVIRLGHWRVNWRIGRYRFMWDWTPYAVTVVVPFGYVSVGRVDPQLLPGDNDERS